MKMIKDDIPTEGIVIQGIGQVKPGVAFEVSEEYVETLKAKGYKIVQDRKKKEE